MATKESGSKQYSLFDPIFRRYHVLESGLLVSGIDRAVKSETIVYPEGFDETIRDAIRNNRKIVGVLNHQSLFDPLATSPVTDRILRVANETFIPGREEMEGFLIPVSGTVANGEQGEVVQASHGNVGEYLKTHHLKLVEVGRPTRDSNELGDKLNAEASKTITEGFEGGFGMLTFIEETTEGGRQKGKSRDEIFGMQQIPTRVIQSIFLKAMRMGIDLEIVPVGIHGSYRIYDPVTRAQTWEARAVAAGLVKSPVVVQVGESFAAGEFLKETENIPKQDRWDERTRIIATRIAKLLPHQARGVYADAA